MSTSEHYSQYIHVDKKLDECLFFLGKLTSAKDSEKFGYYYSAFLTSWRSVFDVLLYDAAIFYDLGFTREMEMREQNFLWIANWAENEEAKEFHRWWKQNQTKLSKDPLYQQRHFTIHRGVIDQPSEYYSIDIPLGSSTAFNFDLTRSFIVNDHQVRYENKALADCEIGYTKMLEIVNNGKKFFENQESK